MTLTPEQFNLLATKDDLKKFVTKDEFNNKMDQIITAVDNLSKKYENHGDEHVANIGAHDRMEADIEKHDERIGKLELSTA